jgi:hypothetical protein
MHESQDVFRNISNDKHANAALLITTPDLADISDFTRNEEYIDSQQESNNIQM